MSTIVIRNQNDLEKVGNDLGKIKYKQQDVSKIFDGGKLITKNIFNFLEKSLKIISRIKIVDDFSITGYVAGKNGLSEPGKLKEFLENKNFDLKNLQNIKNEYNNQKKNKSQIVNAKKRCSKRLRKVIERLRILESIIVIPEYSKSLSNAMMDCEIIVVTNGQNPFSAASKTLTKFLKSAEDAFPDIESVYRKYDEKYDERAEKFKGLADHHINSQVNIYDFIESLNKYDKWYQSGDLHSIKDDFKRVYTGKQIITIYTTVIQLVTRSELLVNNINKELGNLIECPCDKQKKILEKQIEEWQNFTNLSFNGKTEEVSKIISDLNLENMSFESGVKEEKNFGNSRPSVRDMVRKINLAEREGQSFGKDFFVSQGKPSNDRSQNLEKLKQAKEYLEKVCEYMKGKNSTFQKSVNNSKIENRINAVSRTIEAIG